MRRLFLLARYQSSAFAGVELSVAVLLIVLGGLLLPALRKEGGTAAHSYPPRPTLSAPDGPSGKARPVIADGSVRKIKFNINANTFRRPAKPHDSRPLEEDY